MDRMAQSLVQLLLDEAYDTKIRKAGIFRFPSNYRFETHAHPEYEINYINTGACIMEIDGSFVPLKAGECIVIAPHSAHCFMVDVRNACRITQLELTICWPPQLPDGLAFPGFKESFHRLKNCEQLLPLLERIGYYHQAGSQEKTGAAQIDLMLLQLYALLSEAACRSQTERLSDDEDRITHLIDHINENLESELNIEDIARRHGISSRYVRKYFAYQMGMGCSEYITMLRIGRAKKLLWNQEYSVTDVALMSGFSSCQYFCNVFRKHLGITPAGYRRAWQSGQQPVKDGGIG